MTDDDINDEKQPEENSSGSLETKRVQMKFMKRWIELAKDTGKGYVTAYMVEGKFSNMVLHKDDRNI